jgi:hypothetical protein
VSVGGIDGNRDGSTAGTTALEQLLVAEILVLLVIFGGGVLAVLGLVFVLVKVSKRP